jgi:hypothetical protein
MWYSQSDCGDSKAQNALPKMTFSPRPTHKSRFLPYFDNMTRLSSSWRLRVMAASLLILLLLSSLSLSWAEEYAPVYQFTEIAGVTCPQPEWDLVLAAMTNATTQDKPPPQRKLMVRSGANTAAAAAVGVQRELLGCPKWCGKYCMGCSYLSAMHPVTNETTDTALTTSNATQGNGDTKTPVVDDMMLDPAQRLLMAQSTAAVAVAPAAAAAAAAAAATGGQRDVLGCPKWCGKYCVQLGIGCGTLSRRRRRRQLTDNTKCRKAIADIDAALAQVAVKLSQPCRDILRDPTVSCPLFSTTDCYLTHFSVWNADSGLVLIPHMNATTASSTKICRSFGLISLRIETNFMVGPVTLVLYEVRTDKNEVRMKQAITERAAPYTIFGLRTSNSGQRVTLRGEVLNVGSYQLQASDDNPTHTKTVSFTVSSSC